MVWIYRELITCMYRIDVRASHYKINPPCSWPSTEWTDCTNCTDSLYSLYSLPVQSVHTDCTDWQTGIFLLFSIRRNCIKNSRKILTVFRKTVEDGLNPETTNSTRQRYIWETFRQIAIFKGRLPRLPTGLLRYYWSAVVESICALPSAFLVELHY